MPEQKLPIVDNPNAPEIFSGGKICYAKMSGDCVVLTFTSPKWCPSDNSGKNAIVARVVMPLIRAEALLDGLRSFLDEHASTPFTAES